MRVTSTGLISLDKLKKKFSQVMLYLIGEKKTGEKWLILDVSD